jgi:hypothetical protein
MALSKPNPLTPTHYDAIFGAGAKADFAAFDYTTIAVEGQTKSPAEIQANVTAFLDHIHEHRPDLTGATDDTRLNLVKTAPLLEPDPSDDDYVAPTADDRKSVARALAVLMYNSGLHDGIPDDNAFGNYRYKCVRDAFHAPGAQCSKLDVQRVLSIGLRTIHFPNQNNPTSGLFQRSAHTYSVNIGTISPTWRFWAADQHPDFPPTERLAYAQAKAAILAGAASAGAGAQNRGGLARQATTAEIIAARQNSARAARP